MPGNEHKCLLSLSKYILYPGSAPVAHHPTIQVLSTTMYISVAEAISIGSIYSSYDDDKGLSSPTRETHDTKNFDSFVSSNISSFGSPEY